MFFKKLLAFFLITSLLSVVGVFSLTISHTSKVLNEKVMDSSYSTLKETGMHMSDILNNVNEELLSLSANKTLQKELLTAQQSDQEAAKSIVDLRDLTLYSKNFNSNYSTVEIYGFNRFFPSKQTSDDVMSVDAIKNKPWYAKTLSENGKTYWHINYDFGYPQLTGSRVVLNYRNIPNLLAVICIDIDLDKFSAILSNIKLLESGRIYMTSSTGKVLCPETSPLKIISKFPPSGKNYIFDSKTKEFLITQKISPVNLMLVGLVPKGELTKDSSDYTYYILVIAVLVFLLSLFMAFIISRKISKPVITLADAMKSVEKGDFSVQVHTSQRDEIASLYSNFNFMVSKINTLIHEVYESKLKKKDAELKALQAQINPHFLANTLNTVSYMASLKKERTI
ncbi:MAG: cache domain-containing protein, partial [Bacteroidota bacterium]|nr:cache domain-containing protein [Bacteroidota bacterium]